MHTAAMLRSDMFDVQVDGKGADLAGIFPGWHLHDRFGIVIDEPLGGLGATHLIQVAITAFYDALDRRRDALKVYPEIYAFHFGRGRGSHAAFDFWPARREVMVSDDPCDLLDAINDRGITRLAIPNRPSRDFDYRPKERDAALDRIQSAFLYEASGQVAEGDVTIRGCHKTTEYNPGRVLRPVYLDKPKQMSQPFKEADSAYVQWLKLRADDVTPKEREGAIRAREGRMVDGLVAESYRRIGVEEMLARLPSCRAS